MSASYSCRSGLCGTCAVKVLSGEFDYAEEPLAEPEDDEALICRAIPAPGFRVESSAAREGIVLDL